MNRHNNTTTPAAKTIAATTTIAIAWFNSILYSIWLRGCEQKFFLQYYLIEIWMKTKNLRFKSFVIVLRQLIQIRSSFIHVDVCIIITTSISSVVMVIDNRYLGNLLNCLIILINKLLQHNKFKNIIAACSVLHWSMY